MVRYALLLAHHATQTLTHPTINTNCSGGGKKSLTRVTLPIGSAGSGIVLLIEFSPFTPFSRTKYTNHTESGLKASTYMVQGNSWAKTGLRGLRSHLQEHETRELIKSHINSQDRKFLTSSKEKKVVLNKHNFPRDRQVGTN